MRWMKNTEQRVELNCLKIDNKKMETRRNMTVKHHKNYEMEELWKDNEHRNIQRMTVDKKNEEKWRP